MNEHDLQLAETAFLEKVMRYQDGVMSAEEIAAFESEMRDDAAKRRLFAEAQLRSMALHERFRQDAFRAVPKPRRVAWFASFVSRPFAAAAAGLVFGLFCATLAWAVASPRATAERLFSLINGSFDEARLGHGFPRQTGVWSGDEAAITDGKLCFIKPEADEADPSGRAISCDVFQLVDIRSLRHSRHTAGDAVLELSARFADERPYNTKPSVTFFCQLYLFQGDPSQMHESWPQSIADALASGSAQVTTLGIDAKGARQLTARCLLPAEAEFAVVQIAARPNLRPSNLDGLFADDVTLTLKTSPELPIRIVQR